MRLLKTVSAICLQNLRKWQTDYRVWTIAALLIIMVQIFVEDMRKISVGLGTEMPVWIYPFLYSQFHTKLIYTLPVVLLFCNAPFTDSNQVFVYMRVGRAKWIGGQLMYIIIASALYYLFLIAVSMFSTIFYNGSIFEWGKTLQTLAVTNAAQIYGCPFVDISYSVITYFTPFQAMWFTFLMSWLGAMMIGLIIFLCNTLSGTRFLGVLVSSLLVVMSSLIENGGYPTLIPFSPISWNTLDNIDVGGTSSNPSFNYCILVYVGLIAALSVAIFIFGAKKSLDIKED